MDGWLHSSCGSLPLSFLSNKNFLFSKYLRILLYKVGETPIFYEKKKKKQTQMIKINENNERH
jgi:hypothetical protein